MSCFWVHIIIFLLKYIAYGLSDANSLSWYKINYDYLGMKNSLH